MTRYLPIVLGMVLIVGLTIPQVIMTDRLAGTNVTAEQRAELLTLVPKDFGDWTSEDKPVDPEVQKTAGAKGIAISRNYRNTRTGERVDLWLIVGHARDISVHTPDVCYPGSGFETRARENSLYPIVVPGLPDAPFWTNTFFKEDLANRAYAEPRLLGVVQSGRGRKQRQSRVGSAVKCAVEIRKYTRALQDVLYERACTIRRRRPNKARACILREISCRSSTRYCPTFTSMPGSGDGATPSTDQTTADSGEGTGAAKQRRRKLRPTKQSAATTEAGGGIVAAAEEACGCGCSGEVRIAVPAFRCDYITPTRPSSRPSRFIFL